MGSYAKAIIAAVVTVAGLAVLVFRVEASDAVLVVTGITAALNVAGVWAMPNTARRKPVADGDPPGADSSETHGR